MISKSYLNMYIYCMEYEHTNHQSTHQKVSNILKSCMQIRKLNKVEFCVQKYDNFKEEKVDFAGCFHLYCALHVFAYVRV